MFLYGGLKARREFVNSATYNGDLQQDYIDFDHLHHLPYEDSDVDDDSAVVNIGCNTMITYQEKMRAAFAEFFP
jgi:hypothetical protein